MEINIQMLPVIIMIFGIPILFFTYMFARKKTDEIWSVMGLSLFFCVLFFPAAWIYAIIWSLKSKPVSNSATT